MRKKGYFYLVDAIIALIVLSVGVALIFSRFVFIPEQPQPFFESQDIINILSQTKVSGVNHAIIGPNGYLYRAEDMTNISINNTLLQQAGEYYARSVKWQDRDCYTQYPDPFVERNDPIDTNPIFFNCSLTAEVFLHEFMESSLEEVFNMQILVHDPAIENATIIYSKLAGKNERPTFKQVNASLTNSTVIIPQRRMVQGLYFNKTLERQPWGPYVVEVKLWQ